MQFSLRLIKLSAPVGIKENNISTSEIVVSPNPAKNFFIIQNTLSANNEAAFFLYDAYGKEVFKKNIDVNSETINSENIPSGIYFWKIIFTTLNYQSGKLIILK